MHFKIILPVYFVLFMSNVLCTANVTVPNKTLWQSYIVFCFFNFFICIVRTIWWCWTNWQSVCKAFLFSISKPILTRFESHSLDLKVWISWPENKQTDSSSPSCMTPAKQKPKRHHTHTMTTSVFYYLLPCLLHLRGPWWNPALLFIQSHFTFV